MEEIKVWYSHYKGYIVKSWLDPNTNQIFQEKIPYNHPNNYLDNLTLLTSTFYKNELNKKI